jgi:glutamine amidotransferase
MATSSFEGGKHKGLNWIEGDVIPLDPSDAKLKVPHMGWNNIVVKKNHPVFQDIKISNYYFVHSYKFSPLDSKTIISSTNYGEDFVSSLGRDNILGTQFHPEKSQAAGVTLLKNFIEWSP